VQRPRRLAVIRRQAEAMRGGDKVAFKIGEGSEALGGRGWLILYGGSDGRGSWTKDETERASGGIRNTLILFK
jgi:hypothetical protein